MGCFGFICKGCGTPIRGNCFTGGEKCVMIHVRHGEEVGRVEGHYDEYGRVIEQEGLSEEEKFRGDNDSINGHNEICKSEFGLSDSYEELESKKQYNGKIIDFYKFVMLYCEKELCKVDYDISKANFYRSLLSYSSKIPKIKEKLLKVKEYYVNYKKYKDVNKEMAEVYASGIVTFTLSAFDLVFWRLYENKNSIFYIEYHKLPGVKLEKYSGIVVYHSVCYRKAVKDGTFNLIPSKLDPDQSWGPRRKKYM